MPSGQGASSEYAKPQAPQTVWVQGAGGDPRPVPIRTGITDGYFTEVVEGSLKEGDQVLIGLAGSSEQGQHGPGNSSKNPLAGGRRF